MTRVSVPVPQGLSCYLLLILKLEILICLFYFYHFLTENVQLSRRDICWVGQVFTVSK